jgi:hypothetical protein
LGEAKTSHRKNLSLYNIRKEEGRKDNTEMDIKETEY